MSDGKMELDRQCGAATASMWVLWCGGSSAATAELLISRLVYVSGLSFGHESKQAAGMNLVR